MSAHQTWFGSVGYLPTRESYAEGGYEVTHACRVDPAGPEMLESTLMELLDRLLQE